MASNWAHYNMWGDVYGNLWIQHHHTNCMETETFNFPTFKKVADWVQFHECGAQE